MNSIQKGKKAEREIAFRLSRALKRFGLTVSRTPMSGAWKTLRATSGDLIVTTQDGNEVDLGFHWEVKMASDLRASLTSFLNGQWGRVKGWWAQAAREAEANGKIPILLFRQNRTEWVVAMRLSTFATKFSQGQPFIPPSLLVADYEPGERLIFLSISSFLFLLETYFPGQNQAEELQEERES